MWPPHAAGQELWQCARLDAVAVAVLIRSHGNGVIYDMTYRSSQLQCQTLSSAACVSQMFPPANGSSRSGTRVSRLPSERVSLAKKTGAPATFLVASLQSELAPAARPACVLRVPWCLRAEHRCCTCNGAVDRRWHARGHQDLA